MDTLWEALKRANFKVSTDTRLPVAGTVFFALKGCNFDGNAFLEEARRKGAVEVVPDGLPALQEMARKYRETFNIPVIAIGGSNGKTTSKELMRDVLASKLRVHASASNLNNHIGVPLSILSMPRDTEVAIFEMGANHAGEHLVLLDIIHPTHVIVTNNGLDHLEGFGSPAGVRMANKELYDWAREHGAKTFVNKNNPDLLEDSGGLDRILYAPEKTYESKLFGKYNEENIALAMAVGNEFGIGEEVAAKAVSDYSPALKRSQYLEKDGIKFIVDCYNANPTSMHLALESFAGVPHPKGVVLGDMLELGRYAAEEHQKMIEYLKTLDLDIVVLVGEHFKNQDIESQWFPTSAEARDWFSKQNFKGYTFLLKGSRGMKIEKILE